MIRRDYFLRMMEEIIQMMVLVDTFRKDGQWEEASKVIDKGFNQLVKGGTQAVLQLPETELLARLFDGKPTVDGHYKLSILVNLLKKAGDLAAEQNQLEQSLSYYFRGLSLLLGIYARKEESEYNYKVPKIEVEEFIAALQDAPLPVETLKLLMEHYEQTWKFDKAEDALFAMLDIEPNNSSIVEMGIAFYERLRKHNNATLKASNLPHLEVEVGLSKLNSRSK